MSREVNIYYVMNLPQRDDRREASEAEFQTAAITNYEFFQSTHWRDVPDEEMNDLINREYRHVTKDMNARKGLAGCGITHLACIKNFIDQYGSDGTKTAVILEDDFQIVDYGLIKEQIHTAINSTNDWDFIYLGGLRNAKEDVREEFLPGVDIAISVWNAHAYVIRNTQDIYDRMKALFDRGYFADRAWRKLIREDKKNKHKYLITYPYTIMQKRNFSDINNCVR
jgi:hypothetical protein